MIDDVRLLLSFVERVVLIIRCSFYLRCPPNRAMMSDFLVFVVRLVLTVSAYLLYSDADVRLRLLFLA